VTEEQEATMSTGLSIALIAVGAVLTFALEREAEGINLDAVGIILMIVGVIGLVISALFWSNWGPYSRERRGTIIRERQGPMT
jgi:uncharacterized YccA/Bax inhibitor family protein